MIFILILAGFFTLINLIMVKLGFQESPPQRFFTVLNTASFATLIVTLILHTVYQNRNTDVMLLISCGVFTVSYYGYVTFKALSRGLTVIPYPLLIELRGSSNSAYVVDLPQIIIISLLTHYVYRRRKKPAPQGVKKAVNEADSSSQP